MKSTNQKQPLPTPKGVWTRFAHVEEGDDEEEPPRVSILKAVHIPKKPRKQVEKAPAYESDDEQFMVALRPKPKQSKKPFTPDPQKVVDAFHEVSTKVEVLRVYLSQIEKAGDVTEWMDANDRSNRNRAERLLKKFNTIATLLKPEDNAATASSLDQHPSMLVANNEYFVFRGASKSVMLLAPMERFTGLGSYSSKKVLGFVRLKGNQYPEMCAFPGWTACAEPHPKLLDSQFWTQQVLKFAEIYGYKFQKGSYDDHHRVPVGSTYASHVEPKLMLYIACKELQNLTGEEFHLGKLYMLKRSTMQAEIVISENPCQNCKLFKSMLEELTGLKFSVKLAPNLGQLKPKRNHQGSRYYDLDVSDCDSEPEGLLQLQEPEPRGEEFEIQIIAKSSSKKKQTVVQRSNGQPAALKLNYHSQALTPTKRPYDNAPSPPKAPRKKAPAQTISRRRLCHDETDWESEYIPPGQKLLKRPALQTQGQSQDDLDELDRTEERFEKRTKISETWLYRK
jgi:hypothetical protein